MKQISDQQQRTPVVTFGFPRVNLRGANPANPPGVRRGLGADEIVALRGDAYFAAASAACAAASRAIGTRNGLQLT